MRKGDGSENSLSILYHALRAPRRRQVIQLLDEGDRVELTTRYIAREITSVEQNVPRDRATGEPYRNVYNSLSQTHFPTLANAKVIIYDPMRQTVSRGPNLTLAHFLIAINQPAVDILLREQADDEDEP